MHQCSYVGTQLVQTMDDGQQMTDNRRQITLKLYYPLLTRPPIPCEISPPNIYWWESKGDIQFLWCSGARVRGNMDSIPICILQRAYAYCRKF